MPVQLTAIGVIALALGALAGAGPGVAAPPDPVAACVAGADSVVEAGGEAALEAWLAPRTDLAGAATSRLLEAAAQARDAGDATAAANAMARAGRLADRARAAGGSPAAAALVAEVRGWGPAQLAVRREAKDCEARAELARRGGQPDAAAVLLLRADSLYALVPDRHARAVVWGSLGVVHWARSDWAKVEECYQRALILRREVDDRILEGRTLNGLGTVRFQAGHYAEAIEYYHQAAAVRRRTGDLAGLGTTLAYEANCRLQLQHLPEARALYAEALPVLAHVGQPVPLVEALNGAANLSDRLGRSREALAGYDRAIALCDSTPACRFGPLLRINRAMTLRSVGRLQEAQAALESASALLGDDGDAALRAQLHRELGLTAVVLGDRDAARDHLLAAVKLARDTGDKGAQADGLVNLGTLYLQIGAAPQGLQAAQQAQALARELGDAVRLRDALAVEGEARMRTDEPALAADCFGRARDADTAAGATAAAADDEVGLGGALSRLGRLDEARATLRRAARLFGETGRGDETWIALAGLGDTFERERPDSAAWYYDRALAGLERGRAAAGGEAKHTGYLFAHRGRVYEEIALYYARRHAADPRGGWAARAFATAERSRARGLVELLARAGADSSREINAASVATPEQVRRALPSGTVLLQYAVGESATLLWVVDRGRLALCELPPRAALRGQVRRLRDAIARSGAGDDALCGAARELWRELIGPVADRVAAAHALVVVPDDALLELPFEALLAREPAPGAPWGEQPFLGRDLAVTYAPSSTVYLELAARGRTRGGNDLDLLALGDPEPAAAPPRADGTPTTLAPLPAARQEVAALGAMTDPARRLVLQGPDATESALKAALAAHAPRVVHLAAHGLIDAAEPERSCVALAPGGGEDGRLSAAEILALPLHGPLVVLSACESAGGRLERGEGVVGLTRALLAAGARGAVASLWPVADASTSQFMQAFWRWLPRARDGAAGALREARRALLADPACAHPYYWAPFVLVGSDRAGW